MAASLRYTDGSGDRECPCRGLISIGRTAPNDIVIPDPKISRQHALVRMMEDGTYYLFDVGSANGTYLNGKRVVTPVALKTGDVVSVGDAKLEFLLDLAANPTAGMTGEIAGDSTMLTLGTRMEEITFLVCDIRGYTRLSERLDPDDLAAIIAGWFRDASGAIEKRGGVIDKYIGDAIMARWSSAAAADVPRDVRAALRAAQDLGEACAAIERDATNLPQPFRVGVGINTGRALLGTIGASGRREYTAMGDSVNLAFRLEESTKVLAKDVVIGADSYRHLPTSRWRSHVQRIQVKGKAEPVPAWGLTFAELDVILSQLGQE